MTASPSGRPTAVDGVQQAVVAGVVTAVVGFTSSFAVVLAGLTAVGATPTQAASGLLVLCVTMGIGTVVFSWTYRIPITMAWSTPGAALLAGAGAPSVGFGGAVSAFAVSGLLLAACGLIRPLGELVGRIPPALATAMLAGVLLTLCVEPFRAVVADPAAIAPVIVVWLLLSRFAARWAVPGALIAALVVIGVSGSFGRLDGQQLSPIVELVTPGWDPVAILALAVPLFLVTMTSQNIPGVAVLSSFGYRAPMSPALAFTGLASAGGAFLGGHAINLAAISAALAAGPAAHRDPRRRWVAGVTAGVVYAAFGPLSALIAAVARAAPTGLMETIAGLALIGVFAGAARAALTDTEHREAGAVTFVIAASGVTIGGVGAAFWALAGGVVYLLVMHTRRPDRTGQEAPESPPQTAG